MYLYKSCATSLYKEGDYFDVEMRAFLCYDFGIEIFFYSGKHQLKVGLVHFNL